uniref:DNA-directed RNA polymerase subunit 6 homolog n=1 Tax=Abalone asfa-like virus TaxID=2839893 RepID=A0A5K7XZ79_9VIRU|nr:hypothetical protein [Abalone asfa-like virus]BCY04558.1 Putative DNA-directed RNA polymerase subunit 6 [Abalone asfa-like virus]
MSKLTDDDFIEDDDIDEIDEIEEDSIGHEEELTDNVIKNEIVQTGEILLIPEDKKRTSNKLSKAEATRLISVRALQLYHDPQMFLKTKKDHSSTISIAYDELMTRQMPLKIRRCVKKTADNKTCYVEEWDPNVMILPAL